MSAEDPREATPQPPGTEIPPHAPSRGGGAPDDEDTGALDLDDLNSAIAPNELSGPAKPERDSEDP